MVGKIAKNICKVCKREFKLKDSLNHHLEKHHGYEAVSYKCYHCFKRFRWSANLEKHVKEAHTDLERYECGICASTYKYDHHLKQHMHTKHNPHAKPNKCPDCGVLIERRDLFLRHMKFHHPKVVVPVQCKSCPMVFVSRSKLRHHHLKIHANYGRTKCPHCPSTFKWRGHLSGHIKKKHMSNIHVDESVINKELEKSRERTNRCRHCGAIFKLKFDLLVHYRRSHDENISIYRCCQCEAVFVIKSSLERHIVEYHKEKNMGKHQCEQCFPDINVKPISVKVEHRDDKRDEENGHEENHSDTNVARDVENEVSNYFEQTISDHPDLRDMILLKSRISDVVLNTDNTLLNFNAEEKKGQQTVEFEVPLLNSEMEDESKIANTNRDASTQVNFYEDMFCNKNNLPIPLYSSLDGDLWKSLTKMQSSFRIDALSDVSQIARKKKVRRIKTDSRKSRVRYRCEECNICFNMSYSLDNHIQTEHGSENVNVSNEKGDEIEDNTLQDTFINREHSSEKDNSVNTVAVVDKVLQVHLQKIDMNLLKNKVLVSDDSKLSPSPISLYDCKHCSATFRYKRHFFRHAYQKHGLSRTQFNCTKCDLKFDTRIQLRKHFRSFHLHEDKIVTKACAPSLENTKDRENDSEQHNQDVQLDLNNESNKESEENCVQTIFHNCDLCDRKYKLFSQLRRHKTLKHQKVQSYKCKICSKLFKNNVLRRRHVLNSHSQLNKFVCKICNLKFKQDILLKSHYNLEHTKNETQTNNSTLMEYTYRISDKTFKRKNTLIETEHSDGTSKRDRHAEDSSYSDKVVRCDLCNEIFELKIQLLQHKKQVHSQYKINFSCNMCKSIFKSKRALKTHYNLKHSDYYCYDCDLSFRTDSLLQRHIEVSHATLVNNDLSSGQMDKLEEHKLTLSCIKCNLTFNNEIQMDDHIQSLHINTSIDNDTMTTSNCKKCNLNFNTESEMNEHIMEMHPTKKVTFRCSVCHARFNIRDNLLQHIDIEHRHKCGVCQIKFKIKDELLRHMATKHCLSVRLYNCEKCPMTFRLADSLKRHLHETHSEIKVAQSTKTASAIQEQCIPHIMMNQCKHCDALFPRKDSLERHIQWEHPAYVSLHKCGQCASVFSDIEDLKEHLRMEHFADIIVYKATASKSNE